MEIFHEIIQLRIQKDRAKGERHSKEHSADRLTWITSQISQIEAHELEDQCEDEESETSMQLTKLVSSIDKDTFILMVKEYFPHQNMVLFLRAVLDISEKPANNPEKMIWMYEELFIRLRDGQTNGRLSDIFSELLSHIHSFPNRFLAQMVELSLKYSITENSIVGTEDQEVIKGLLEILTKFVFRLNSVPKGLLDPDCRCTDEISDLDGDSLRIWVMKKLCVSNWTKPMVLPILSALLELGSNLKIPNDVRDVFVEKCLKEFEAGEVEDIHQLFYHLLSLSNILQDRVGMINSMIEILEVRSLQSAPFGKILSQLNVIVSQDASIGLLFLKILDNEKEWSFSKLSFLLTIGRSKRFENKALEMLRKRMIEKVDLHQRLKNSVWLKDMSPHAFEYEPDSIFADFYEVCKRSKVGNWDLLIPVLIKCCISFVEEHKTSLPLSYYLLTNQNSSFGNIVSEQGIRLLETCFRHFPLCRAEILEEIIRRVLTSENVHRPFPFIRLLNSLSSDPELGLVLFLDYSSYFKELIILIPSLPIEIGFGLLFAIGNGISKYPSLLDHALIVFRKSLFQRELVPRQIGLLGILSCMRQLKEDDRARDVLGCLRRCLTQQFEIKNCLYRALLHYPVSIRADLTLSYFHDNLANETDDTDIPPLRFEACVDKSSGNIVEPLGPLMQTMCIDNLWDFSKTIEKMIGVPFSAFSFDKTSCFDVTTKEGLKNVNMANLLINSCEVLMEYEMKTLPAEKTILMTTRIVKLFRLQRAVRRLVDSFFEEELKNANKRVSTKTNKEEEDENESITITSNTMDVSIDDEKVTKKRVLISRNSSLENEGKFLSQKTIHQLLVFTLDVQLSDMIDVGSNRDETSSLFSNLSFHLYLMNAVSLAIDQYQKNLSLSDKSRATIRGLSKESLVDLSLEITEIAVKQGDTLDSLVDFCLEFGPLLYRLFQRYTSLIRLKEVTGKAQKAKKKGETSSSNASVEVVEILLKNLKDILVLFAQFRRTTIALLCSRIFKQNGDNDDSTLSMCSSVVYDILCEAFANQQMEYIPHLLELFHCIATSTRNHQLYTKHAECLFFIATNYEIKNLSIVKTVIKFWVELSLNEEKTSFGKVFERLANSIIRCFGDDSDDMNDVIKMIRTEAYANAALNILIPQVTDVLNDCEYALGHFDWIFHSAKLEEDLLNRIERVCSILSIFLRRALPKGTPGELILRCVCRMYNCCIKFLKKLASTKKILAIDSFARLTQFIWRNLTPNVDERLREFEADNEASKKKKTESHSSKRESKLVPDIVFNLEQYEVQLLKVIKCCGNSTINLANFVRRATARDFKVDTNKLRLALDEEESEKI